MKIIKYIHRTVTHGDWGVSCTTGSGINGAILHLYRQRYGKIELPHTKWMRGFGDGRLFPSQDDAWQWAFDHGYLKLYFTSPDLRARRKSRAENPTADPLHYARYKSRAHSLIASRKTWTKVASSNGIAGWGYEDQ